MYRFSGASARLRQLKASWLPARGRHGPKAELADEPTGRLRRPDFHALADTSQDAGRPPLPAREPLRQADTAGPAFTEEAIMDAVNAAKTDATVIAHEWTSTMVNGWDRQALSSESRT